MLGFIPLALALASATPADDEPAPARGYRQGRRGRVESAVTEFQPLDKVDPKVFEKP